LHKNTEHYTPQHILDAVFVGIEAIDLDPCSNSREICRTAMDDLQGWQHEVMGGSPGEQKK